MQLHTTKLPGLIREAIDLKKERYFRDGNNLYFRVQSSGSAAWVVRKRYGRRLKLTTLGRWNKGKGMTLAEAREKAQKQDSRAAAHSITLGMFLREYYTAKVNKGYKRPENMKGYFDRFEKDEPALWNTKLRNVEQYAVFQALQRYAKDRGNVAAARLSSILKTAFRRAVNGPGYLNASPIASLSVTEISGTEKPRERVLTDAEIRAVWYADGPHTPLLRFLLLTGQRIGETQLATWDEVGDVWNIPAEHTKNGRAHWVPLPPTVLAIINAEDHSRRKVFGHTTITATQAWLHWWCAKNNIEPNFTPHDLRRTYVTRLNELGVAPHIVEKNVNHTLPGIMGVYNKAQYADERRDAAARWAAELQRLVA
jgi:integrase